jgi:prolipoprotein diacylglyceryltransferase
MLAHMAFDGLAWLAAILVGWRVRRTWLAHGALPMPDRAYPPYIVIVWVGAIVAAVLLGSANLVLAGQESSGRSILGALVGGIATAELYKLLRGVRGSTGIVFVVPLALGIAIGRIGCFTAGIEDFTYGTPTLLPWGVDFGDGIARHPVQLYESLAMVAFLAVFVPRLWRGEATAIRCGFYLFAGWYAAQRFVWEFLKPYPAVVGPFNLFHLVCIAVLVYAVAMLALTREPTHAPA